MKKDDILKVRAESLASILIQGFMLKNVADNEILEGNAEKAELFRSISDITVLILRDLKQINGEAVIDDFMEFSRKYGSSVIMETDPDDDGATIIPFKGGRNGSN